MIDKIRNVDKNLIRTAKRIELGLETEEEAREAEKVGDKLISSAFACNTGASSS